MNKKSRTINLMAAIFSVAVCLTGVLISQKANFKYNKIVGYVISAIGALFSLAFIIKGVIDIPTASKASSDNKDYTIDDSEKVYLNLKADLLKDDHLIYGLSKADSMEELFKNYQKILDDIYIIDQSKLPGFLAMADITPSSIKDIRKNINNTILMNDLLVKIEKNFKYQVNEGQCNLRIFLNPILQSGRYFGNISRDKKLEKIICDEIVSDKANTTRGYLSVGLMAIAKCIKKMQEKIQDQNKIPVR